MKNRAGVFMNQPSGYTSFIPKKLPPDPEVKIDAEMMKLLSDADRKLGRLDVCPKRSCLKFPDWGHTGISYRYTWRNRRFRKEFRY